MLWQLPENFHRDDERLGAVGWRCCPTRMHTIEFRHASWFAPAVLERSGAGVALTIGDHPKRPFQSLEATADWRFVRFHYGSRGRGGNYSATELEPWARRIAQWRRREDVYAYFNNDWSGFAPGQRRALRRNGSGLASYHRLEAPSSPVVRHVA